MVAKIEMKDVVSLYLERVTEEIKKLSNLRLKTEIARKVRAGEAKKLTLEEVTKHYESDFSKSCTPSTGLMVNQTMIKMVEDGLIEMYYSKVDECYCGKRECPNFGYVITLTQKFRREYKNTMDS